MEGNLDETRATDCSICLEEFRDPRLLPCGHTLCSPCLQRLIGGTLTLFIQRFRCPLCRRNLAVPAGGAQGFPSDVSMADALTTRRNMRGNFRTFQERNQARVTETPGVSNYSILAMIVIFLFCSSFKDIVFGLNELRSSSSIQITKEAHTISAKSGYLTMGLIRNEMFLINPATTQGEIRNRKTLSHKSPWNVSDFYGIAGNTFCKKNNYLYVSTTRQTILKFDSDGDIVAKWSTGNAKGRPLIMADCNVAFIPHSSEAKIFIYTPYGDLIRVVQLKLNVHGPRLNCAVHFPNGNFIVSYGTDSDAQHGLSLVNWEGNVLRSFGETKGKGNSRVNGAYDLFVEKIGDIHVVDHNNHRIVRLNSYLEFLNQTLLSQNGQWVRFPHGALYDELHHRVFVMGSTWDDTKSVLSPGKIIVYDVK